MTAAPVGAIVGLSYDSADEIVVGDYLVTKKGRYYKVLEARRQGDWDPPRWKIRAIVDIAAPMGARQHPLAWHRRDRRGT